MRFRMLATDYDNTIAVHGVVSDIVRDALTLVRRSGRVLMLVTGRTQAELDAVFDAPSLFDAVVLENGALLQVNGEERLLAPPIPDAFVAALHDHDVAPLAVGRAIVSTAATNAVRVSAVIEELGLDLSLHRNRDSVMVLPPDMDKAVGLRAAVAALALPLSAVVAMGDGENDCSMLRIAGAGVAVENALEPVKRCAGVVLTEAGSDGIRRLCDSLVEHDLADLLGTAAGRG
jgi:phosphoglycolate phosphatase